MKTWLASLRVYREPRLLAILFMGFASGLPLPLTFATLSFWLAEGGVSRTNIGLFVLVGFAYNYKFLWSPVLDRMPIPWLTRRLGRRRSWALVIQALLMAAIFALGRSDPRSDLATVALLAVLVAFLSASQDIVIDAYRIELLKPEEQGPGAAATQWGSRLGLLAAGAGPLYAAAVGGRVVVGVVLLRGLFVGGLLQMLSNLMYVAQVLVGHDNAMLAVSIFTENFTNGMGSAAFVAYLSSLCSVAFTATQYALFSSLAALPTRLLSAPSGWLIDRLDWIPFFLVTTVICVPGLLVLLWLMRRPDLSRLSDAAAHP